jgi:hypothetical protein
MTGFARPRSRSSGTVSDSMFILIHMLRTLDPLAAISEGTGRAYRLLPRIAQSSAGSHDRVRQQLALSVRP